MRGGGGGGGKDREGANEYRGNIHDLFRCTDEEL
jgi:hypothetical protein